MALEIKTGAQMYEEFLAHRKAIEEAVTFEDGVIEFTENKYWVDVDDIANHEYLIKWIRHLLGKKWMKKELMIEFIDIVCREKGWEPFGF